MEKKILVSADPYDIGIIIEEARVVIEVFSALNFVAKLAPYDFN